MHDSIKLTCREQVTRCHVSTILAHEESGTSSLWMMSALCNSSTARDRKTYKKLSYCRDSARRRSLRRSRSFKVTDSTTNPSPYAPSYYSIIRTDILLHTVYKFVFLVISANIATNHTLSTSSLAIAKRACDCCIVLKSGSYTKAI